MKIFEACPVLENEEYIIRPLKDEDCDDLQKVCNSESRFSQI